MIVAGKNDSWRQSEHMSELQLDLDASDPTHAEKGLTSFLQACGIFGESSHCVNAKLKNERKKKREGKSVSLRGLKMKHALTMAPQ